MKPLLLVCGWLLLCVVVAALLTPWAYVAAQSLAGAVPALETLAHHKFHRFFNRTVMILAVAGIIPLGRVLGYRSLQSLGMTGSHRKGRFLVGFGSSILLLGLFAAGLLGWGHSVIDPKVDFLLFIKAAIGATLVALLVAGVEEVFFRGFLYDIARKEMNVAIAMILISLFYSCVHFIKSPGDYAVGEVHWDSMLRLLPKYFSSAQSLDTVFFGGLNLLIAGLMLAWAYQHTGSLYLSMGIHAGWIWILKFNGKVTDWSPGYPEWLLGNGGDLTMSPAALLILLIQWWALRSLTRQLIVLGP